MGAVLLGEDRTLRFSNSSQILAGLRDRNTSKFDL